MLKAFFSKSFHSLYHKNYRYFFFGQMLSLVGTWMQVMAQAWLIYTITGSAIKLGMVGAVQFLPTLLFGLFAGVLVDKFPKKKILIITQTIYCLQALVLFFLIHNGVIQYWQIMVLTLILGCVTAIDMPARQAYVVELVGKQDVVNAVGLNSAIYNLARILGPAIAGAIMTWLGIEWCFFINGISFLTVIISLFMINTVSHRLNGSRSYEKQKLNIFQDVKAGLLYIRKNSLLLKTSLIILFITILSFNYNVLIPVFAKNVLGLQEKGFGILLSALGVGSLIGALLVSISGKSNPKGRTLLLSSLMLGVSLFVIGFSNSILISSILLGFCGVFNLWFFTNANSILQINSSDEFRGRVMGVYAMVFAGTIPIGNLLSGYFVEKFGVSNTFIFAGLVIVSVIILIQTIHGRIKF